MRVRTVCAAAGLLAATAAHAQGAPSRSAADTIANARRAQNELLWRRDIDSAATFWTDDIVVLAGLGARVEGRSALRAAFSQDSVILYRREPEQVEVSRAWPIAWERGRWVGVFRGDTSIVLISGWYSARWLRDAGRWRIQGEQFVADDCHPAACSWPLAPRRVAP